MLDDTRPVARPRDANATRAAIFAAARHCFTRAGYDQVGIREIAAAAGVNPALVIRYFGSKEGLIREIAQAFELGSTAEGDRRKFGERLARKILTMDRAEYHPTRVFLNSAANETAAAHLRAALEERWIKPLAAWLGGDRAELRAGLIAAYVTGLAVARDIFETRSLAGPDVEELVRLVAPVIQAHVDDTVSVLGETPAGITRQ